VVALLALSSGGPDKDREDARIRAARNEQRLKAARAREESIRKAEAEQARARMERERLEKEVLAKEEAGRKLVEEKSQARDEKFRDELKAREADLAKTAAEFRERLRLAQERERQAADAMAKAASPPADPPAQPVETAPGKQGTRTSVARIERATAALLVKGDVKTELKGGEEVDSGQGLEAGPGGAAILVYADTTRLELGPETEVNDFRAEGGKRLFVAKGEIRAKIAKQPAGQPMVFLTPYGEAKVLGTTLRLLVSSDPKKGARLEVEEGKVQFKSNLTGKTVDVLTGHYTVAALGAEMTARSLPIADVVLFPRQAKMTGDEWRMAKDPQAPGGLVLEASMQNRGFPGKNTPDFFLKYTSYVTFTFNADADKDYHVWIRGCYIPLVAGKGEGNGSVAVEAPTGRFTGRCVFFSRIPELSGFMFDFFKSRPGYWWVGGNEQPKRVGTALRFAKSGPQVLRLYGTEPLLIDCIWLSAVQDTRPDDNAKVPFSEK
ncbi:MAG: FecR domain-containing protein, partial [Acidobacteria bacterium]|nr:FecR domain-containing protein [Acidobacteriota bacterium]